MSDDNRLTRRGTMAAAGGLGLAALLQGSVAAEDDGNGIGESDEIYVPLMHRSIDDLRVRGRRRHAESDPVVVPLSSLDYIFPFYVSLSGTVSVGYNDDLEEEFERISIVIEDESNDDTLWGSQMVFDWETDLGETKIRGKPYGHTPVEEPALYDFDGPKHRLLERDVCKFSVKAEAFPPRTCSAYFRNLSLDVWAKLSRDVLMGTVE